MTIRISTTDHDHIPEEFSVASLREGGFSEEEITALGQGDDPLVDLEADGDAAAAPAQDLDEALAEGAEPQPKEAAAPVSAESIDIEDVPDPEVPEFKDTAEEKAVVAAIDERLADISNRYDEGDMTNAEFIAEQKALIAQQTAAQVAIQRAEEEIARTGDSVRNHWFARVDAYKQVAPELFSDEHLTAWDRKLRSVTGDASYSDMSRDAQIRMAHRLYAAEYEARNGQPLNIPVPSKGGKSEPRQKADGKPQVDVRTDKRPDPISTLSGYNADTGADVEDSRHAAIDKQIMRDPLAAEKAFDSMSADEQDRYLNEV